MVLANGFYPRFGELMYAELPENGSVQSGTRPVLIVQNDVGNRYSTTVEVLPLSSRILKASHLPTHVYLEPSDENGLRRASVVLAENTITIPQERLRSHLGFAGSFALFKVAAARLIQSPLPYKEANNAKRSVGI